jgi:hypothetical protein
MKANWVPDDTIANINPGKLNDTGQPEFLFHHLTGKSYTKNE